MVADQHGISQHQYADDTSLYVSLSAKDRPSRIDQLERCLTDVRSWFNHNGLALNPDKSEVIHLCPVRQQEFNTSVDSLDVAGSRIVPAKTVKCLGVTLDTRLSFDRHVQLISANALYHIRGFRQIRRSISQDCAKDIACAIVGSRLDYCNALLYNTSVKNMQVLQRVQNTAARVITGAKRFDHIRPHLRDLHWLPVASRIKFKLATLTYKAITTNTPVYLAELLSAPSNTHLRSSEKRLLVVP